MPKVAVTEAQVAIVLTLLAARDGGRQKDLEEIDNWTITLTTKS